jgi:GNAT superfamily N-acetyltransferase
VTPPATPSVPVTATARMRGRLDRLGRTGLSLREVRDGDAGALVRLIGAAYDEFDCGPLDPSGFDADLVAPATHANDHGRCWWVVADTDDHPVATVAHSSPRAARPQDTVGTAGTVPGPSSDAIVRESSVVVELHRLYLAPQVRGQGVAGALVAGIVEEARMHGAHRLIAWSDTRLTAAHVRYLALGFTQAETSRELGDPAGTTEVRFDLMLER